MRKILLTFGWMAAWVAGAAAADDTIRLGLVTFGTAAWEVDVMHRHGLDSAAGLRLDKVELADPAAGEVALRAGAVDAVVTDWLWVSRQRHAGQNIVFVPHSSALGEILVSADSPLTSLADLPGKRLGVAGGPLDKSWLLLRAYGRQKLGGDLADRLQPQFAAPPLLSMELAKGRLDAALTFWPFAARLEAQGYRPLASMAEVMEGLGFSPPVPMLGYAFSGRWISAHPDAGRRFLAALDAADRLMGEPDEWDMLKSLTGAPDEATSAALRRHFLAGLVADPAASAPGAARLYALLGAIGGAALTGGAAEIASGTFWRAAPQ